MQKTWQKRINEAMYQGEGVTRQEVVQYYQIAWRTIERLILDKPEEELSTYINDKIDGFTERFDAHPGIAVIMDHKDLPILRNVIKAALAEMKTLKSKRPTTWVTDVVCGMLAIELIQESLIVDSLIAIDKFKPQWDVYIVPGREYLLNVNRYKPNKE